MSVLFWVSGDMFKVTRCGQWITMWTDDHWHTNPVSAWNIKVRTEAANALEYYGMN